MNNPSTIPTISKQSPLLFAKAFYFFFYGAGACLAPFLVLYYRGLGFSGTQIGLLASISPLVTLFAAPFWSGLADATHKHKLVLVGVMSGAWLAVLGLSQARNYWLIALLVALYAFFISTVIPLIDNAVLNLLGERRDRYGVQRLWGAIGWGLAGPVIGELVGRYGLGWSFAGYLALLLFTILSGAQLPIHITGQRVRYWSGITRLLADRSWLLFLLIVFLAGVGLSVVSNYLFLYMDQIQASRALMGWSLTTATISEIPVLFFSGHLIRRFGPRGLLMISLAAFVARAYGYAAATAPWQVLLIQLLHGLTFSTMLVAGVSFAAEIAPPGLGATAQGLFSSTMSGFGGITGSLVGGILLDHLGGAGMYFWVGTAVFVGLLVFVLFGRRMAAASTAANAASNPAADRFSQR